MHPINPPVLCIVEAGHNRGKCDSQGRRESHVINGIIVARRITLNVTSTNGRKRKEKARRQMKESQPKKSSVNRRAECSSHSLQRQWE